MPIFESVRSIQLESGTVLPQFHLAYETWGTFNNDRSNVIWVFHALTANAKVDEWWPGLFGPGKCLDPERYKIICVNMPGSCYGSLHPLDNNPETNTPYYETFPLITPRDMINMYEQLRESLGIERIFLGVGGSMGGMQALEWSIEYPERFKHLAIIATNAQHSPWGIGFNTAQRMAIEADTTWESRTSDAARNGLIAARAIAMLSYRNYHPFKDTQSDNKTHQLEHFKASSYLQHQGEKLADRFNAYSYYALTKSMDAHHIGRNRGGILPALNKIKASVLVIGIESDILFPPEEQLLLARTITNARFHLIDSPYGHDGFLIETQTLNDLLLSFLQPTKRFVTSS